MHHMEQVLRVTPKSLEMILVRDLNAQLGYLHENFEEDLATALVDRSMVNMTDYFMPR